MAWPFLGLYRAAVNLVALGDNAAMAEAYVVGMVVPQEQPGEEDGTGDNIEALFDDSSDSDADMSATMDDQVMLLASFETAHRERVTRQLMATEWEAPVAMLMVRSRRGKRHAWPLRRRWHVRWHARRRRRRRWRPRRRRLMQRRGQRRLRRRRSRMQQHWRRWPGTGHAGMRTWPQRGAPARSTSSRAPPPPKLGSSPGQPCPPDRRRGLECRRCRLG
jgi:hypothetical protein